MEDQSLDQSPYASQEFLHNLLSKAVAAGASDIHLKVGQPPGVRVDGSIRYFKVERLLPDDTEAAAALIIGGKLPKEEIKRILEHDCSYAVPGLGRFRVNVFKQRDCFSVALRSVPVKIPTLEELGLPPPIRDLALRERGLVLVTGPTGSGKTSTLASMVDLINENASKHIVTIEDPIEFMHADKRSCVSQREVGHDTHSFARALRSALRQDPDVILVGEIRDQETMEIAMQASETGHLVLSTLHTPDVNRTVNRLLAFSENPAELRERIADCLQGIVSQRLLPKVDGGRVVAPEILIVTGTVREALKRPEQNPPLKELMEKGVTPYGMQTFQMVVTRLAKTGVVSKETAQRHLGF